MTDLFTAPEFPLSNKYNTDWIKAGVSGGANPLWLTEWLAGDLELKPGMRVLDLGCGRAMSSIFLNKEFGVKVWAVDLMVSATENYLRINDAGVADSVFPLKADARDLPFASEFFDAIVSIDSFFYYGTDDLYLNSILRYLKPDGSLAIAGAGLMQEHTDLLPDHLKKWWTPDLWCLHSATWWKHHWERTGMVDVKLADSMIDGWKFWLRWHHAIAPDNTIEIDAIEQDAGRYLGYVRTIAQKRNGVTLEEPVITIPFDYTKKPVMR